MEMIRSLLLAVFAAFTLVACLPQGNAAVELGKPAPDFIGVDSHGQTRMLSDLKGRTVVLEWTNHGCPFVRKHYGSGNMQALQKKYTDQGVVWLSIVSSAEGKQGNVTPEESLKLIEEQGSHATARILDPSGEIGRLYGAKTTPHMFVIDAEGILVYAGAIDNNRSPNPATIEGATNYVAAALDAMAAGQLVDAVNTQPYGCSVKY
jgi:peroxiredoxin